MQYLNRENFGYNIFILDFAIEIIILLHNLVTLLLFFYFENNYFQNNLSKKSPFIANFFTCLFFSQTE
jgi:hypothetical protein